MFKWFVYIVVSLILIPFILAAKSSSGSNLTLHNKLIFNKDSSSFYAVADTTIKAKQNDDKKKIKEIRRAKPVPKPEKIDDQDAQQKAKKRQRRPPGMERPPEIPRHNGN
jgi:hypothetical protein